VVCDCTVVFFFLLIIPLTLCYVADLVEEKTKFLNSLVVLIVYDLLVGNSFFTLSTRVLCFFASVNAVSLMWNGVILIIDFCVCFFASLVTKEDALHPPLAIAIPVLHH